MARGRTLELLLNEWVCLGVLVEGPRHGFDVARRLHPSGDLGSIWTLSRPLTYRALDQLTLRGHVAPLRTEPGVAGGERTILGPTPVGRRAFDDWLLRAVPHVRSMRDEFLLKLQLTENLSRDPRPLLQAQRAVIEPVAAALAAQVAGCEPVAPVLAWRLENARGALRFLDRIEADRGRRRDQAG